MVFLSTPEVDLQNVHQLSEHVMVVTGGGAFQFMNCIGYWGLKITLPKTNMAPENRPSQKETSIPTIHFQVLC